MNGYRKIKQLDEASLGDCYLVEKLGKQYAMKVVHHKEGSYYMELEFLKAAEHPFLISHIEDFPHPNELMQKLCIVLEYANGCDLRTKITTMGLKITENVALNWFTHVCLGLAYMHYYGLAHVDIKPEYIIIFGEETGGMAKLGDFWTNKQVSDGCGCCHKVRPFQYFVPEMDRYQQDADIWQLGIVLYEMVSGGQFPFDYDFEKGYPQDYMEKLPSLEIKQLPDHISTRCKTLIIKMLEKDPAKRPTINEVLQSDIIKEKIRLITEQEVLGSDMAERIRKQLIDLEISLTQYSEIEENKESLLPAPATLVTTQLSELSLQPQDQ
ncbi:hypothetical protein FGO68_gene12403 [Halteria grandinella]|uniref:non-specific serine/threonine protein kinase n=1 Tax=Halteria grandinella TaxID=5974 RepID=A0A8J8NMH4_HALGN|nr:hypothetical protein FGO68_gene12403 [Halteria grandinella]